MYIYLGSHEIFDLLEALHPPTPTAFPGMSDPEFDEGLCPSYSPYRGYWIFVLRHWLFSGSLLPEFWGKQNLPIFESNTNSFCRCPAETTNNSEFVSKSDCSSGFLFKTNHFFEFLSKTLAELS